MFSRPLRGFFCLLFSIQEVFTGLFFRFHACSLTDSASRPSYCDFLPPKR